MPDRPVIGWDIGGAHVKACLVEDGRVRDIAQWAAPLWQGLAPLDGALAAARARWPGLGGGRHALTMTAEMTDLFPHREAGVTALAAHLAAALGPDIHLYAGSAGWVAPTAAREHWVDIASANWLATAELVARRRPDALLVDIGSTTTDLIPVVGGRPQPAGRSDADRLASGELVYLGVVRTPLCALARRIVFDRRRVNVMNEFFATTADVFRLTGELDGAHDQHPAADNGEKDLAASCERLARMIGRDARDARVRQWRALAGAWRHAMLSEIGRNLGRVVRQADLGDGVPVVGAGAGQFLARILAERCNRPFVPFHALVGTPPAASNWADVCAPSVAVALLFEREAASCGS